MRCGVRRRAVGVGDYSVLRCRKVGAGKGDRALWLCSGGCLGWVAMSFDTNFEARYTGERLTQTLSRLEDMVASGNISESTYMSIANDFKRVHEASCRDEVSVKHQAAAFYIANFPGNLKFCEDGVDLLTPWFIEYATDKKVEVLGGSNVCKCGGLGCTKHGRGRGQKMKEWAESLVSIYFEVSDRVDRIILVFVTAAPDLFAPILLDFLITNIPLRPPSEIFAGALLVEMAEFILHTAPCLVEWMHDARHTFRESALGTKPVEVSDKEQKSFERLCRVNRNKAKKNQRKFLEFLFEEAV